MFGGVGSEVWRCSVAGSKVWRCSVEPEVRFGDVRWS